MPKKAKKTKTTKKKTAPANRKLKKTVKQAGSPASKQRKRTMAGKKDDDTDREHQRREDLPKSQQGQPGKNQEQLRREGEAQAKENEKTSPLGGTPKPGSLDPGKTTMANPPPANVVMDPVEPTEDPMATPPAGPLPNPPSRPGGDPTGEPNVSPTGEKLDPNHPDYRKDAEGYHAPDHRSAEEKKANPRE